MQLSIAEAIAEGQKVLGGGSDTRQRCIRLLASQVKISELKLRTSMQSIVEADVLRAYFSALQRLKNGEPDAYVIGQTYFYGYPIYVGEGVLIPRPDSELLVTETLRYLNLQSQKRQAQDSLQVLELCTGSACLSLVLAREWQKQTDKESSPCLQITATEISEEALGFAKKNHENLLGDASVKFEKTDLWPQESTYKYDLLFSNPPYVTDTEYQALDSAVKDFEPSLALLAGADGLDFYRRIFSEGPQFLKPGAFVLLEHGYQQAEGLRNLAKDTPFRFVSLSQDFAKRDRVSVFQYLYEDESEACNV